MDSRNNIRRFHKNSLKSHEIGKNLSDFESFYDKRRSCNLEKSLGWFLLDDFSATWKLKRIFVFFKFIRLKMPKSFLFFYFSDKPRLV